jgi:hypothetical protein
VSETRYVGILTADSSLLQPERIAGTGPDDSLGWDLNGIGRDLFVWNGDVSRAPALCNSRQDARKLRNAATERDINSIKPGVVESGILEEGRERVRYRVTQQGHHAGRTTDSGVQG